MIKKRYKDTLNIDESYFVNRINSGSDLRILFMSHKNHWPYIEKTEMMYKNSSVKMVNKESSSLLTTLNDVSMEGYDLITFYTKEYDENEYTMLKVLTQKILNKKKQVTIGYAYLSHDNKYDIRLAKFCCGVEFEEIISDIAYLSPMELITYTLLKYENIVHKKYREKINKKD